MPVASTKTAMGWKKEDNLMAYTRLMKITGVYQILSPHVPKIYGLNMFSYITVIQLLILTLAKLWVIIHIYYLRNNIYHVIQYFMLFVSAVASVSKLFYMIRHSETIWNCIQLTSINCLSYKHHNRQILETGQQKSKLFSTVFTFLWLSVVMSWLLTPFILNKHYLEVNVNNNVSKYRLNVLNLIFPVNDKFYNEHFLTYYCMESITTMFWGHGALIFDIILISMCITFSYQLRTIGNSYSTFGFAHNHMTSNKMGTIEYNESVLIHDFKILINDQQKVIENMQNTYKIFRPVMLLQIFADSLNLILLSSIAIMNYLNGMAFISSMNLKSIVGSSTYILHLYCISALFSGIDEQKESMNFSMYCSNWTEMSLRSKKLMLYAMQMDSAENMKLKLTRERVVNFEMFTNIMRTTYSILSVLVKNYSKTS